MCFRPFPLLAVCGLLALGLGARAEAVLRPGEVFELRLTGVPADLAQELALQYTVAGDGTVKFPYLGAVRAAGTTAPQLADTVERKLIAAKIFTHPTVLIAVQPGSRYVTLGGHVRAPQAVPWSPDLTLYSAILRAGGPDDWTGLHRVMVTRENKSTSYNVSQRVKHPEQNPKLLPGDEIEVKE